MAKQREWIPTDCGSHISASRRRELGVAGLGSWYDVIAAGLIVALSGCGVSSLVEPKTNPIIEDSVGGPYRNGPVATLATTPERRLLLVDNRRDKESFGNFCAEPPADVAESVSSSFQAALAGNLAQPSGQTVEASAELAKALATATQALAQRSQGVMIFRDGSYYLCSMYMNNILEKDDYIELWTALLYKSAEVTTKELAENGGKIGHAPPENLSAPELAKLISLLEQLRKTPDAEVEETAEVGGG